MLSQFCRTIKDARAGTNRSPIYLGLGRFSSGGRATVLMLFLAFLLHAPFVAAQGLDPAALLKPATDTWPTYNGDYSGRRFSPLDQINATNIDTLTLAWIFPAHVSAIKSTPLEVNGVLYFTTPDNVWAVDRSEEHTSELQSQSNLVCRLLLEKKKRDDDQRTAYPHTAAPRLSG